MYKPHTISVYYSLAIYGKINGTYVSGCRSRMHTHTYAAVHAHLCTATSMCVHARLIKRNFLIVIEGSSACTCKPSYRQSNNS